MIFCLTAKTCKMLHHTYSITGASEKQITIDLIREDEEQEKPLVIFSHGFKGFKDWGTHQIVARYFAEQGLNFLKFNFSHNGISAGSGDIFDDLEGFANNTISKELFDLDRVITFALSGEKFRKPSQIFLIGHSLGGAISIIQASENKSIHKLATWASISNFRNLWNAEHEKEWIDTGVLHFENSRTKQQMPIYSSFLDNLKENAERLNILSAAQKMAQPWLIIHGEEDPVVPIEHAIELHNQQNHNKLLIIASADHVFCAKHPWNEAELPNPLKQACDATIAFFQV